ncbi:hypothetical protein [Cytobacillus oceanisediminis]|uniref:hypothetical protein n=1 Tax=Cytobacillus oceanisediminis TaxID=665099 RepID=UPI00203E6D03|nr:hypothetical protein [Cytobacillus oceanisediminis]MCM3404895.1 hypothetical protein [Cytobacillus oceanisediminis]
MPVVFGKETETNKIKVESIFYQENDLSSETQAQGVIIKSIPDPETIEGKAPVLYLNKLDNTLFYEYVDRELTESEKLNKILRDQETMKMALDDLIFSGGAL